MRVSTRGQDEENQEPAIIRYCEMNDLPLDPKNIMRDHGVSGFKQKCKDRLVGQLIQNAPPGSHLVFNDVTRLGRQAYDVMDFAREATQTKGVTLHFIKDNIIMAPEDSKIYRDNPMKSATSKMMMGLFAGLAEMERQTIRDRVLAGLKRAILKGKKLGGRKSKDGGPWKRQQGLWKDTQFYDSKQFDAKLDDIKQMLRLGQSQRQICDKFKWKRSSLCMYIKRHGLKQSL